MCKEQGRLFREDLMFNDRFLQFRWGYDILLYAVAPAER